MQIGESWYYYKPIFYRFSNCLNFILLGLNTHEHGVLWNKLNRILGPIDYFVARQIGILKKTELETWCKIRIFYPPDAASTPFVVQIPGLLMTNLTKPTSHKFTAKHLKFSYHRSIKYRHRTSNDESEMNSTGQQTAINDSVLDCIIRKIISSWRKRM